MHKHIRLLFLLVLPLPSPHLRCGGGCRDLGSLQQGKGTDTTLFKKIRFQASTIAFVSQVVTEVTEFYKQTYTNYKDTKQEALKETLRLIHFGVRTNSAFFGCYNYKRETNLNNFKMGLSFFLSALFQI